MNHFGVPTLQRSQRKATSGAPPTQGATEPRAVRERVHSRKHRAREPGDLVGTCGIERRRGYRSVRTYADDARRREVGPLNVPRKPPNDAAEPAAEGVEGSEPTKGNSPDRHDDRTQRRCNGRMASSEYVRQPNGTGNSVNRAAAPRLRHRPSAGRRTSL
jgi:hypothetical protein